MYKRIVEAIDQEIAHLQKVRALLDEAAAAPKPKKGRGRPKGLKATIATKPIKSAKRVMSAEARAKIAAAQKKKWAASKKATS